MSIQPSTDLSASALAFVRNKVRGVTDNPLGCLGFPGELFGSLFGGKDGPLADLFSGLEKFINDLFGHVESALDPAGADASKKITETLADASPYDKIASILKTNALNLEGLKPILQEQVSAYTKQWAATMPKEPNAKATIQGLYEFQDKLKKTIEGEIINLAAAQGKELTTDQLTILSQTLANTVTGLPPVAAGESVDMKSATLGHENSPPPTSGMAALMVTAQRATDKARSVEASRVAEFTRLSFETASLETVLSTPPLASTWPASTSRDVSPKDRH